MQRARHSSPPSDGIYRRWDQAPQVGLREHLKSCMTGMLLALRTSGVTGGGQHAPSCTMRTLVQKQEGPRVTREGRTPLAAKSSRKMAVAECTTVRRELPHCQLGKLRQSYRRSLQGEHRIKASDRPLGSRVSPCRRACSLSRGADLRRRVICAAGGNKRWELEHGLMH